MASERFDRDLKNQGFALEDGECFVTLQHLLNLMWDTRCAYTDNRYNEPTLEDSKLLTDEVIARIKRHYVVSAQR